MEMRVVGTGRCAAAALLAVFGLCGCGGGSGGGIIVGSSSSSSSSGGGASSSSSSSSSGAGAASSSSSSGAASVSVLTYHNDVARTGQNLHEAILTPANVNAAGFGKLGTLATQGKVDAEPLYVPGLSINGATHNVVFVATEHAMVYAFDADNFASLWSTSVLPGGEMPSDQRSCSQVTPEIGITATPVIDPGEVAETFELPLALLLAEGSFQRKMLTRDGLQLPFMELVHGGHRIWGATAGILWNLRRKLLGGDD